MITSDELAAMRRADEEIERKFCLTGKVPIYARLGDGKSEGYFRS